MSSNIVVALVGESDDKAGTSVSFTGDVNGDGIADLVIGAPGVPGVSDVSSVRPKGSSSPSTSAAATAAMASRF